MTAVRKNLGDGTMSSAGVDVSLYTVPADTDAVLSTLVVCNQGIATTFRVRHRVGGAVASDEQLLFCDPEIPANATAMFTLGITMAAGDILAVQAATSTVSFNAYGQETS